MHPSLGTINIIAFTYIYIKRERERERGTEDEEIHLLLQLQSWEPSYHALGLSFGSDSQILCSVGLGRGWKEINLLKEAILVIIKSMLSSFLV